MQQQQPQDNENTQPNLLRGFDTLINSVHQKILTFEKDISPKLENVKILMKLEKERALKDSTTSRYGDPRLSIPSWKLRVLTNLNWITEGQALISIQNFKTAMLENLDVEPTAVQEKHFSVLQPTAKKFFEELCGLLESCSDAMADYLAEAKRTQPNALIIYDDAIALAIELLKQLENGTTIKSFDLLATQLISLTKRIEAKMIEKRNYMTDRLAWRGIGIENFNFSDT